MKKKILSLMPAVVLAVSLAVPALAVTPMEVETDDRITAISGILAGDDIPVVADYDNDGTNDFTYTIPGVIETNTYKMAPQFDYPMGLAGKDVTVLTIKAGTKINLEGAFGFRFEVLQYKDGLLQSLPLGVIPDYDNITKSDLSKAKRVDAGNGQWYEVLTEGAFVSFVQEGYYAFEVTPFVPQLYVTDSKAENFGHEKTENRYKYGGLILRVIAEPVLEHGPGPAIVTGSEVPGTDATPAESGANDGFSLDSFKNLVASMEAERRDKKLYDVRIRALNSQLIDLNARKKPLDEYGIGTALKDLRVVLSKVELNDLAVYASPGSEQTTDSVEIARTHMRFQAILRNLERAMETYGA